VVAFATVVTGCASAHMADTAGPGPVTASSVSDAATPDPSRRLVLRFDDHVATGILDDTPAAREFAAMLPLTLHLSDPMGQAKSGPLPRFRSLDVAGANRTHKARVGELAYWSPSSTFAIVYDDLGQTVPPPGLVRLGVIDNGLPEVADAGNGFTVHIDLTAYPGS
jgi:hypothetical protein